MLQGRTYPFTPLQLLFFTIIAVTCIFRERHYEVKDMYTNTSLLVMKSVTYAMKGQNILRERGIPVSVERLPNSCRNGCGYCLRVQGDPSQLCRLLDGAGVPCERIIRQ